MTISSPHYLHSAKIVRTFVIAALSYSTLLVAQADEYSINSHIDAVTVYPSSARVTRQASVSLGTGKHILIINDLPAALQPNTLRIHSAEGSNLSLGHADLQTRQQSNRSLQKAQQLEDKIQAHQQTLAQKNDNIARLKGQIEFVYSMAKSDSDASQYHQLPMDQWGAAWQMMGQQIANYQSEIRRLEQDIDEIKKQIGVLERQLSDLGNEHRAVYQATIEAASPTEQTVSLTVTYQINHAYWSPLYDISLDSASRELEIETLATVKQQTGEDWQDVSLRLSTREPNANTQLPDLWPWTVDLYDPADITISSNSREFGGMAKAAVPMMAAMEEQLEKTSEDKFYADTAVMNSDFSTEYLAPNRITLPSSTQDKRISLETQQFTATTTITAVPQLSETAMLVVTTDYLGDSPLLGGNASLYLDGQFVGEHYLRDLQPGGPLELGMGEDPNVRITFRPDPERKSESGVFSKEQVIQNHYLVRIANQHINSQRIVIKGHFPVPEDELIKVRRLGDAPTRTDLDDQAGVVAWDFDVPAGEEQTLKFGFRVSHPADKELSGL